MKAPTILTLTLLLSVSAFSGQQSEFTTFDDDIKAKGISSSYTPDSYDRLISILREQTEVLRADALKQSEKDAKKTNTLATAINQQIEAAVLVKQSGVKADNVVAFRNLRSLLYSVKAKIVGPQSTVGGLDKAFSFLGNGSLQIKGANLKSTPLTVATAALESYNLVDPSSGKEYVLPSELVGLTPEKVSQLDVRADNTMWMSEQQLNLVKAQYGSNWKRIEQESEAAVSKDIGQPYSLDLARRVLVYDQIKDTATSAKIETQDLYGQDWKLKWSEENHSEPITNRLYVNLGAKWTDLVYANSRGEQDVILILSADSPEAKDPANCNKIATVEKFEKCLLLSKYNFGVKPYIQKTGVVTAEMLANPNLPISKINSDKKVKLIGRTYLAFYESSVSFQPSNKLALRLGAAPFSHAGAIEDRAKRGAALFSYWIRNKDAKDDNNRALIANGQYIEFMHDLGASLANLKSAGFPNVLEPKFMTVNSQGIITFDESALYIPTAFERATYADILWMARKILSLSEKDIREAVAATQWPSFQMEIMASRLISRRNEIAQYLGGSQIALNQKDGALGNSLRTRQDRIMAVEKWNIQLAFDGNVEKAADYVESIMKSAGIKLDKNGVSTYSDPLYKYSKGIGTTMTCQESVLIAALESTVRPTGLGRRTARGSDDKGLSKCVPLKK